jgi:hypothetical protein|tara:strand:- start:506 stop:1156 length:651 start_codon:yes stop_codon:yes gene_type:complete
MNIGIVAGHFAFGLIAFSFLVKDILWLRVISTLASLFSVFYNYVIPPEPMWIPIGWNMVFAAVNVYHIAVIIYEKRPVDMSPKHKELYETMFKNMTPVEFLKITKIADWVHFKKDELITQKGHSVPTLNLIFNGTVDVVVEGKSVAELKDGQFVGEMSFLTEKPATATCKVKHDTECLVWEQKTFKELLKRNPSLYFTIQSLLSAQVSSALVDSNN